MIAGRFSKAVAFVAILAALTFGALATASAQSADIKAIDKAFQDHYARGNWPAAQIDAQELERLVKARFGADHANYAVALNRLGVVFQEQGKYTEAEGLFKRALAIIGEVANPDVDRILKLANAYQYEGKFTEARDLRRILNNLSNLYRAQGKYTEAEDLLKRVLEDREQVLGASHPDSGRILNNLADLYQAHGKYTEAEDLLKRALAIMIMEEALGNLSAVRQTLNNLINVYQAQGKFTEALAIKEKVAPAPVGQRLIALANVYQAQGKYTEAEDLLKRVLDYREKDTDKGMPATHTVEIMFNLPANFPAGGISNVPGILMKQSESTRGVPLAGLAVKVPPGLYSVGLSNQEADKERNLQLLKERGWFDIPVVYNNNRRAILAMEKGTPGGRAFADAFTAWKQ